MGFGDELMATGMARDARSRGRRAAFGDGRKIIFGPWSEEIFRGNPNIAYPGDEKADDIEWIAHYKGHRLYNSLEAGRRRWLWNRNFRAVKGEIYFTSQELEDGSAHGRGFVLIEPNVPREKSVAPNKDWGFAKYQKVADALLRDGHRVAQFAHGRSKLSGVEVLSTKSFRNALAILQNASLYIGPEGGLHHGAAAVGVPGVVLFGGFIPPEVTGYEEHTNLTGGAVACGSICMCHHCLAAMKKISVDEVLEAARGYLRG